MRTLNDRVYYGEHKIRGIEKQIKINLRITHECNFHCSYCIAENIIKDRQRITLPQYEQFLRNIELNYKDYDYVDLHLNGGEPCTHPDISAIINMYMDRFPTSNIGILTNGCMSTIPSILSSIKDLTKLSFVTSYHPEQISLEDYIKVAQTYYEYPFHNHIRMMLSESNMDRVLREYDILKDTFPNWQISIKIVLLDEYEPTQIPKHIYKDVLDKTARYLSYNGNIVSAEDIIFDEDLQKIPKVWCLPMLYVLLDGSYRDRQCPHRITRQSNIFTEDIEIFTRKIFCTLGKCSHHCDFLAAKYVL